MKRGTVRSDGMVYYKYSGERGVWIDKEKYESKVRAKRDYQRMCYAKYRERNPKPRRFGELDPKTGLRFVGVGTSGKEIWRGEEFYQRRRDALLRSKREHLRRIRMSMRYKVRFHLGAGENFMKWQVRDRDGGRTYYEPSEVTLEMRGCKLHNSRRVAERIHGGAGKTVCAWISCSELVVSLPRKPRGKSVCYNPRVKPHWRDSEGNDLDNATYDRLVTTGSRIVAPSSSGCRSSS